MVGAWGSRVSGTERIAITTVTTASGRLMRKIHRQLAWSIRTPPTKGPIADATPPRPDQAPIARARSLGPNEPWIIARLPGVSSAPPTPCRIRAAMRTSAVGARPHSRLAAAKSTVPSTNIRRRPKRSPSEPPIRIREASIIR